MPSAAFGSSPAAPLRFPSPGHTQAVKQRESNVQPPGSGCLWTSTKCFLCTRHYLGLFILNLPTTLLGRCPLPSPSLSSSPWLNPPPVLWRFSPSLKGLPCPQTEKEKGFRSSAISSSQPSSHGNIVISLEGMVCPFFQQVTWGIDHTTESGTSRAGSHVRYYFIHSSFIGEETGVCPGGNRSLLYSPWFLHWVST